MIPHSAIRVEGPKWEKLLSGAIYILLHVGQKIGQFNVLFSQRRLGCLHIKGSSVNRLVYILIDDTDGVMAERSTAALRGAVLKLG